MYLHNRLYTGLVSVHRIPACLSLSERPRVSGTATATKAVAAAQLPANSQKAPEKPSCCERLGKTLMTANDCSQLVVAATELAMGLASGEKSSPSKIHGTGPIPMEKATTKSATAANGSHEAPGRYWCAASVDKQALITAAESNNRARRPTPSTRSVDSPVARTYTKASMIIP